MRGFASVPRASSVLISALVAVIGNPTTGATRTLRPSSGTSIRTSVAAPSPCAASTQPLITCTTTSQRLSSEPALILALIRSYLDLTTTMRHAHIKAHDLKSGIA